VDRALDVRLSDPISCCLGFFAKSTLLPIDSSILQSRAPISIDELHRSIDMKALPVHEVKDPI
jgi:hypothetical protein